MLKNDLVEFNLDGETYQVQLWEFRIVFWRLVKEEEMARDARPFYVIGGPDNKQKGFQPLLYIWPDANGFTNKRDVQDSSIFNAVTNQQQLTPQQWLTIALKNRSMIPIIKRYLETKRKSEAPLFVSADKG